MAKGRTRSSIRKAAKRVVKKAAKRAVKKVAKVAVRALVARAATKVATRMAKRVAKAADRPSKPGGDVPPAFAHVAAAFANDASVTGGTMMSAYGLKVNGKIFAMLPRGSFVAKLPRARVDALVADGTGVHFDPGHGRLMKEWISIDGQEDRWVGLAREALAFVKGK